MPPELPTLAGVRHEYHEVNGFRMHVAEAGDPSSDPLFLLHGWPQHWWCWHKVIPALSEHYRVICPDLRGHGWSDAPQTGYDKPQLMSDVVALLDAMGLDRVRLVGHDWGAMVGFLACLRHPERIDRYIALSIAPPFPSGDRRDVLRLWRLYYQVPLTLPVLAPRLVSRPGVTVSVLRAGTARKGAMSRADIDLYARAVAERPQATLGLYRTFVTRELFAIASGRWAGPLRVPTRMLIGEHEPVGDAERARAAGERYADDYRVYEIPGAGHFLPEEAPDELIERALPFFA